ncbi:MAG: TonB-dependent receptor plug domain-containing protein [Oscillatoriales cyanobacterium SM2_1_8]|nr:TonB-dependent receptor plug domain-containing protein [Oscillatoriales cyanobacterium SM2_1_8]
MKAAFWWGVLGGLGMASAAIAQPETVGQLQTTPTQLGDDLQITVTTTRTPRQLLEAPGTVTVFDRENLERNPGASLRDILRYEPGLSVQQGPRAGIRNINIRGLDDARVLLQVDGIRLPNEFNLPPFGTGRDFVDLGTLRRVEVLRGPGSSLYGSDALGGGGHLQHPGAQRLSGGSGQLRPVGCWRQQRRQQLHQCPHRGRPRRSPGICGAVRSSRFSGTNRLGDPQFRDRQAGSSNSYFGKLVYRLDEQQTLKLTADILNRATNTFFAPPNLQPETGGVTTVTSLFSGLSANRSRVSLDYDFNNPEGAFRAIRAQIYYQDTQTPETTLEERRIAPDGSRGHPPSQVARRDGFNNFLDRIVGGSLQLSNAFTTGELNHILTYGVDLSTQRNERPAGGCKPT